jgi:imidazoleglycerol phosphate synthase glutamine amidotransferase subunit HisH
MFDHLGTQAEATAVIAPAILSAQHFVLPGIGAFDKEMQSL